MKKIIIPFFIIIIILFTACESKETSNKSTIGVSITPEETFIKKIVGDTINVVTLIPPGSSPETYQPSPKVYENIEKADLYFSIGVPTEHSNILPVIKDYKNLEIVKLDNLVDNIYKPRYFDEESGSRDPHIWLSPKRSIKIVEIMTKKLIETYPENKKIFTSNSNDYIEELKALDNYILNKVSTMKNKSFIIYHPSYGYFADDYGLTMIAIEKEGKHSSISQIDSIIKFALEKNIKTIYYQEEMSSKQAKIIANEINGQVIKLKPLSPNYIENIKSLVNQLDGE